MSDYSKITNFLAKDSLPLNNAAKYVKGSEIDAEFNAIAVAVATKADEITPTFTTALIINSATQPYLQWNQGGAATGYITENGGSLLFSNDSGIILSLVSAVATPTSYLVLASSATGIPKLYSSTTTLQLSGGSGGILLTTATADNSEVQVKIVETASADRYITLTGSNGGNPTIGVSAGSLKIASAVFGTNSFIASSESATPAGGTSGTGFMFGTDLVQILWGSGAPSAVCAKGSLYLRTDGSGVGDRMYINTDGAGTWTAVTTAA